MKKLAATFGVLGFVFLLFYSCTHKIGYTNVYPRVVTEIQGIAVSDDGDIMIRTKSGFLVFSLIEQLRAYSMRPYARVNIKKEVPLPKWTDIRAGPIPPDLVRRFHEVPIIRDGIASSQFFAAHASADIDALVVFENEGFSFNENFAWVEFHFYTNRPLYREFQRSSPAKTFLVEIPSRLETHMDWKSFNFIDG